MDIRAPGAVKSIPTLCGVKLVRRVTLNANEKLFLCYSESLFTLKKIP